MLFTGYKMFFYLGRSKNGMELLACSHDGTVAFIDFTPVEIGTPLSKSDVVNLMNCM